MISDDDEIVATLSEVAGLLKAPGYSQCFPFDCCIALFCRRQETGAGQGDPPAPRAAVWDAGGAATVLLKEEVANATTRTVGAKASRFLQVEDLHALMDGEDDGFFG